MQSLLPRFEYSLWGPKTNYFAWRWWNTLFCQKIESRLRQRKGIWIFEEISPPITTKHIRTWTKKSTKMKFQIWNKRIRFLLADALSHILNFNIISINFNLHSTSQLYSTYSQLAQNPHDLLSLQRRNPVDSRFWSRLCYYCSKWSRQEYNNQLTRDTPSCLAIAVVSEARFLG